MLHPRKERRAGSRHYCLALRALDYEHGVGLEIMVMALILMISFLFYGRVYDDGIIFPFYGRLGGLLGFSCLEPGWYAGWIWEAGSKGLYKQWSM
jgi:hypothetical protein